MQRVADPELAGLASAVRELRRGSGLTQEQLAHRAGLTTASLARLERARTNPGWKTLRALATALDVAVADIADIAERDAGT